MFFLQKEYTYTGLTVPSAVEFLFEQEHGKDVVCRDEVDRQILEELRFAGEYGMLPRDIAARLGDKRFTQFYASARLKQMNKKLEALLGRHVAEKRGKNWALTSFIRETWGSTKKEILESVPFKKNL